MFPGEDAIGQRSSRRLSRSVRSGAIDVRIARDARRSFRIVGVVADVQQGPIGQAAEPVMYHAQRQFPFRAMTLVARGATRPPS